MSNISKPKNLPNNPRFSSGPCTKHAGWSPDILKDAALGRSHHSELGKAKLTKVISLTREILEIPNTHKIAIVPASDTGAVEIALWSLLGCRDVDMLAWESFGYRWINDVENHLQLKNVRKILAPYGELPNLKEINFENDVVFTWNGTTSGVRVPNADFIPSNRQGLTICDATSAAFAQKLDFDKLDVTTFSWQKVMGGEAAHGMMILSPRAIERLENYTPSWPLPKLFRLVRDGKILNGLFEGATINTPSMLCVEDYLNALKWAKSLGGLTGLFKKTDENFAVIEAFVEATPWLAFQATKPVTRSNTSVCLKVIDPGYDSLSENQKSVFIQHMVRLLEEEKAAFDITNHRDAPAGLRIWCGATVEKSDLVALLPWLNWAFQTALAD